MDFNDINIENLQANFTPESFMGDTFKDLPNKIKVLSGFLSALNVNPDLTYQQYLASQAIDHKSIIQNTPLSVAQLPTNATIPQINAAKNVLQKHLTHKRAKMLELKILILNIYILKDTGSIDFGEFLSKLGIPISIFVAGLPPKFNKQSTILSLSKENAHLLSVELNSLRLGQFMRFVTTAPDNISREKIMADFNAEITQEYYNLFRKLRNKIKDKFNDTWHKVTNTVVKVVNDVGTAVGSAVKNTVDKVDNAIKVNIHNAGKALSKINIGDVLNVFNKVDPLLIAIRAAFEVIIRDNVMNVAVALHYAEQQPTSKHWKHISHLWYDLGGKPDNFTKYIKIGFAKAPKIPSHSASGDSCASSLAADIGNVAINQGLSIAAKAALQWGVQAVGLANAPATAGASEGAAGTINTMVSFIPTVNILGKSKKKQQECKNSNLKPNPNKGGSGQNTSDELKKLGVSLQTTNALNDIITQGEEDANPPSELSKIKKPLIIISAIVVVAGGIFAIISATLKGK